jgi:hypothetical protein
LQAQTFSRTDGTPGTYFFSRISLKPDTEWAGIVQFSAQFSEAEEGTTRKLVKEFRAELAEKLRLRSEAARKRDELVEAEAARVREAESFFHAHNKWQKGEYEVSLKVECVPARAAVERKFRFTLFEADAQEMVERVGRYKYGFGVSQGDPHAIEVLPRMRDLR